MFTMKRATQRLYRLGRLSFCRDHFLPVYASWTGSKAKLSHFLNVYPAQAHPPTHLHMGRLMFFPDITFLRIIRVIVTDDNCGQLWVVHRGSIRGVTITGIGCAPLPLLIYGLPYPTYNTPCYVWQDSYARSGLPNSDTKRMNHKLPSGLISYSLLLTQYGRVLEVIFCQI